MSEKQIVIPPLKETNSHPSDYEIGDFDISNLTYSFISAHCSAGQMPDSGGSFDLQPQAIEMNAASFTRSSPGSSFPVIAVKLSGRSLLLSCPCPTEKSALCPHQAQVLFAIMNRRDIRIFFDEKLRAAKIRPVAMDYGLEKAACLDDYFFLEYSPREIFVKPRLKELLPLSKEKMASLQEQLMPLSNQFLPPMADTEKGQLALVLGQHKYYSHLYIELCQGPVSQSGKIKNPIVAINPLDLLWKTERPEELKFYSGISKFQNSYSAGPSPADLPALKALVKNPLQLPVYYHNTAVSANITAGSLLPIQLQAAPLDLNLEVQAKDNFFEVSGKVILAGHSHALQDLTLQFHYFILLAESLYLIDDPDVLRVIHYFRQHNQKMLVHASKFEEFRMGILASLENKIQINYTYLKPATPEQLQHTGLNQSREKIIYLSDSGDYVLLTPVMKYGEVEIPVLSKRQLYATDARGKSFALARDEEAEFALTGVLLQQHPDFYDQLHQDCFYLHKNRFLMDDWFLEAFAAWQSQHITILGFKELKENKLNPHKASISVLVTSGINWFDTAIEVRFGKQKVPLKYLHKSLRNKNRFVPLDDGTLGILPQEWIEKLSRFFQAGHLVGDSLRTPKISFSAIPELYQEDQLSPEVKAELSQYQTQVSGFTGIRPVAVPPELQASLREYQRQGLNWLNFLDEFNFGGCLADDMGLGKTIQIIAFILSQQTKGHQNTNLVVVPTSLLFNWEAEVAKFAPTLRLLSVYGPGRSQDLQGFDDYHIILTSYGTLLSDVGYLKKYRFNYIFLDESQAIKNPQSQRFRAVQLLQARNRVVLTGTPIENNTFDVYGQLAFACPGLLGNQQFFKAHYASPIDKFKDSKRARELQQKINPFILRRTKEQVATELPEKTEMVVYCPMGAEQRRVYDHHEKMIRDFLQARQEEAAGLTGMHVLRGLTKLRQICDSPALLPDEKSFGEVSAKVGVLVEQIESKSPHHKILVFSQFVGMLSLIRKELQSRSIRFSWLTGQTRNRAAVVDAFQQDAGIRVFLISLKAGGTGLNLTAADYVYLVDPWWNPAVENQAIDRIYRIGQEKRVVAVRLICPDTIEAKMMQLQESKIALARDLIKTDANILKSLSKQQLLALFA